MQRPRALLTNEIAERIYSQRPLGCHRQRSLSSASILVSRMFSISPKAIRDIWNRRTWIQATKHLWHEGETRYVAKPKSADKEEAASPSSPQPTEDMEYCASPPHVNDAYSAYPHAEITGFKMEAAATRSLFSPSSSPTSSAAFSAPGPFCFLSSEHDAPGCGAFGDVDVKAQGDACSGPRYEDPIWVKDEFAAMETYHIPCEEQTNGVKSISADIQDSCRKAQEWMICPETIGIFIS